MKEIPQVHSRAEYGDARWELDALFNRWTQRVKGAEEKDARELRSVHDWCAAEADYQIYNKARLEARAERSAANLAKAERMAANLRKRAEAIEQIGRDSKKAWTEAEAFSTEQEQ